MNPDWYWRRVACPAGPDWPPHQRVYSNVEILPGGCRLYRLSEPMPVIRSTKRPPDPDHAALAPPNVAEGSGMRPAMIDRPTVVRSHQGRNPP